MKQISRILFVCTGNTARSPLAEYLARHYSKKNNLDLTFSSAGFINAFSYIQPESRKYLEKKSISYSDFKPQLISRPLLINHDLIITMESSHKNDILREYSGIEGVENKVFTLKEYIQEEGNLSIPDPYYTSNERYRKIAKDIDEYVKRLIEILEKETK